MTFDWDSAKSDHHFDRRGFAFASTMAHDRRVKPTDRPGVIGGKSATLNRSRPRTWSSTLWALGLAAAAACATPGGRTAPVLLDPASDEWTRPAPPVSQLRFETTKGVFVLELHRDWGPIGADRLYNLARLGYYNDTRFHRVRAGYIAQFGLHGDSAVNAAWKGRYLKDDPPRSTNTRGTFAFSYEGPGRENTRNTQIYINLADNPRNDPEPFTVLGTVVQGMEVVDALYSGYGEESGGGVRQGRQGPLERGGNGFMDREYPLLDRIVRVTVRAVAD